MLACEGGDQRTAAIVIDFELNVVVYGDKQTVKHVENDAHKDSIEEQLKVATQECCCVTVHSSKSRFFVCVFFVP